MKTRSRKRPRKEIHEYDSDLDEDYIPSDYEENHNDIKNLKNTVNCEIFFSRFNVKR